MTAIAVQLWTVREQAQQSLPETLAKLKGLGYEAVETAGTYGRSVAELRRHLEDAGLALCSAHARLPEPDAADEVFAEVAELGATAVFPSLHEEHFVDDLAVDKAADWFNEVLPVAEAQGISLGYHNHWWEFTNKIDGRPAYERFRERLDPAVTFEVDTYWAQVGGVDAAELVGSLGERVHYLHLKDGPVRRDVPQTAVGAGSMDVPGVLGANPGIRWGIVELDEFDGEIWDALRDSLAYLSPLVG